MTQSAPTGKWGCLDHRAFMSRVLCLGRTSRTLLALAAAFVLCMPPSLAAQLVRTAQPQPTSTQPAVQKSCCDGGNGNHEACAPEEMVAKEVARASCCQHSNAAGTPKAPGKSCCGGMGGCGCLCCPSLLIAVVPPRPFEWSSPVLEQASLQKSFVLVSRRDVPPTPPPNVA